MKKEKFVLLLSCMLISLCGCETTFDPFDFNNLEIISSEEASYISNEATNNLSYVNKVTKTISSVLDTRMVYEGSASSLARFRDTQSESEINLYHHGLIDQINTKETQGDGSGNTLYFESVNLNTSFVSLNNESDEAFYELYQVNDYENPNYSSDTITSMRSSFFSSEEEVDFKWDKLIRDYIGDGYSYSDFNYGTTEGKIYAFIEDVSQNTIDNPLHGDQIIMTFTERMVVRYFKYDEYYGWVIDYFAEKENLYWITSIEGEMYETPELVESSESLIQYEYGSYSSRSFAVPSNTSSMNAFPIISSFTLDEEESLALLNEEELDDCYLISGYKDDNLTYLSSLVDIYSDTLYLFSSSNEAYSDQYLGYDIINYDQLGLFAGEQIDDYLYLVTSSSVKVYLIFGFTQEGQLKSVDSYYWSYL